MTGYLLPRLAIPWWWRWLHYGVPLPYTFQIATSVQLYCAAAVQAHPPRGSPPPTRSDRTQTPVKAPEGSSFGHALFPAAPRVTQSVIEGHSGRQTQADDHHPYHSADQMAGAVT